MSTTRSLQQFKEWLFIHIMQTNRNVTCDNLLTSVPLAEQLIEKGLTLEGMLQKNKPQIPEFFIAKNKQTSD